MGTMPVVGPDDLVIRWRRQLDRPGQLHRSAGTQDMSLWHPTVNVLETTIHWAGGLISASNTFAWVGKNSLVVGTATPRFSFLGVGGQAILSLSSSNALAI
ncbi:hypothetical protein B0H16DRAFT_1471562 [Mycena metata]|uniref:Uncharacterized protein n=1 Tax=Mycena metata TaxID=1033252 RepID=A0AAD7HQW2_9AGAR|nr:hypothetical protein B0H16DRAFT_1471562 [Mycena metata]